MEKEGGGGQGTYIDELDLPDLLDQLHGGVAVDEEGLGVVAELQRLQPLGHRRGVVAVVADRPHLRGGRETERSTSLVPFFYLEAFYYLFFFFFLQDNIRSGSGVYFSNISAYWLLGSFHDLFSSCSQ